ncbi:MAG: hypothetical protein KA371_12465 [Acidobacteria bacterium]|jgi:mono/diheme cytochrome c family protein|nr:hypothetical protein [Acidobacteriota bacterium]
MARTAVLLMAALTLASVGGVMAARTQGATTNDGVYTAAQAAEGKALYGQVCESCHQPAKFSGAEFARAYGGRSLVGIDAAMFEMPMDDPGSLKRAEIAALIAYFLELNEYPAGSTPLSGEVDALNAIAVAPRP